MKNFIFLLFLLLFSCKKENFQKLMETEKNVTILVQPFSDMNSEDVLKISNDIRKIYPKLKILNSINFPESSYYIPRNRYRADSIIKFLNQIAPKNSVIIGLTNKDISATKGNVKDFGIMGLGFRPGNACVASSFRLNKSNRNEQFFKVAIHEIGHTQGLKHCVEKNCFMRDAEGKNPTDEETDFCKKCKNYLENKNWKFKSI